jgi:hypothetical protein
MTIAEAAYRARLRISMRGAIRFAQRRQALKATPVKVDLTLEQAMEILRKQDFRCALSRLRFWTDGADRFGPSLPSIDRIDPNGPYSAHNVRIVLLGVNSLRGRGTDADMYRIARALVANGGSVAAIKAATTRAGRDAADPEAARARYLAAAAKARETRRVRAGRLGGD